MKKTKTIKKPQSTEVLNRQLRQAVLQEKEKTDEALHLRKALIASIGDGVVIIDAYGAVTDVNERALSMLGYSEGEMLGAWLPEILPAKDRSGNDLPLTERTVAKALLTGEPVGEVVCYVKKSGETFPVYSSASPLISHNKPVGAIIVFRDYSQELKVEKAKDEFVSFASHQLRTPLTAAKMYIELLKDPITGKLNAEQCDYLDKVNTSIKKMLGLVSDFLNVAKLDLGELEIAMGPKDMVELVAQHIAETRLSLVDKKILLEYDCPTKPIVANVDAQLIGQVVHNLLTNAVRYTPAKHGKIYVKVAKDSGRVLVSVSDNGIGIPDEAKPRVFDRFYRAENAQDALSDGTGLGLYLAKKIVEASDGQIWFTSTEAKGTTFYLSLPASHQD